MVNFCVQSRQLSTAVARCLKRALFTAISDTLCTCIKTYSSHADHNLTMGAEANQCSLCANCCMPSVLSLSKDGSFRHLCLGFEFNFVPTLLFLWIFSCFILCRWGRSAEGVDYWVWLVLCMLNEIKLLLFNLSGGISLLLCGHFLVAE